MTRMIAEEEATGKVKEVYDDIKKAFGMVPNFFKAQAAVDPDWMELNWMRTRKIMIGRRALDRKTKELIALTVSLVNDCQYCCAAHEAAAKMCGADQPELDEIRQVIELFSSFNSIADTLRVPLDVMSEVNA